MTARIIVQKAAGDHGEFVTSLLLAPRRLRKAAASTDVSKADLSGLAREPRQIAPLCVPRTSGVSVLRRRGAAAEGD